MKTSLTYDEKYESGLPNGISKRQAWFDLGVKLLAEQNSQIALQEVLIDRLIHEDETAGKNLLLSCMNRAPYNKVDSSNTAILSDLHVDSSFRCRL